jgi:bifunctional DNA-binding transcriptional regulator/antitoxin component of YhaV-PrlF toxin-antitoxin module
MAELTIRNTRLKVSPGGVITLPVSARRALGMQPRTGGQVSVTVEQDAVVVAPAGADGGFRVSPRGQLELRGDALKVLEAGERRHYYFEASDERKSVTLHPWR